jgi:hypothetical protein
VEYHAGIDSMHCPTCAASTCLACKTRSPHDSSCRAIISALMDELQRPLPAGTSHSNASHAVSFARAGIVRCPMRKCRQLLSKGDDNCDKIVCNPYLHNSAKPSTRRLCEPVMPCRSAVRDAAVRTVRRAVQRTARCASCAPAAAAAAASRPPHDACCCRYSDHG